MGAKAEGVMAHKNDDIPIHLAIRKKGFEEVVLALLEWGAEWNQENAQGVTALVVARQLDEDEHMAQLLRHMHPTM